MGDWLVPRYFGHLASALEDGAERLEFHGLGFSRLCLEVGEVGGGRGWTTRRQMFALLRRNEVVIRMRLVVILFDTIVFTVHGVSHFLRRRGSAFSSARR